MDSGLTRGDRIPDFKRPDHRGETRLFYDLHPGEPLVVFLLGGASDIHTRIALQSLSAPHLLWQQAARLVLVKGSPAECAALLDGNTTPFTLLADDGALATHLLGNPALPGGITAWALDANRCVLERLAGTGTNELITRLADIYQQESPLPAQVRHRQAPVLLIPRVFEPAFCRDLIALFDADGGQPSGVARIEGDKAYWQPDASVKMRRDYYLQDNRWLEPVRALLARRVLPEIQRCFNFQVTQHEVFKLVRYDAETGGYFRPHRDNESRDTQHRRFAMTLNLNTGDYEGGQLQYPEFGPDLYEAERGGALVFSCSLLHEAKPVTRGKRYVLLGFFFGEAQSMAPIQYR